MFSRSLRRRIWLYTSLAVLLSVGVISVVGYITTRQALYNSIDSVLLAIADNQLDLLSGEPQPVDYQEFVATHNDLGYFVLAVGNADGESFQPTTAAATLSLGVPEGDVAARRSEQAVRSAIADNGADYRMVTVPIPDAPGWALTVARPLAASQSVLLSLSWSLLIFGVPIIVVAGLLGRMFAHAGLSPVRDLTRLIEHQAATGEPQPVAVTGSDELGRLAVAFNHLLRSLREARTQQTRLIADAGHELRTPLTSLRMNTDLLRRDEQQPGLEASDRSAIWDDVHAQLSTSTSLIAALLQLTRAEDHQPAGLELTDLRPVIEAAVETVENNPAYLHLSFALDLHPTIVASEPDDILHATLNILENAAAHSPAEGTVHVTLRDRTLRIEDEGSGVAAVDLPHIFDRFYRADQSRSSPGNGLGLAIVQQIVNRHHATVSVARSRHGGAAFVIVFV